MTQKRTRRILLGAMAVIIISVAAMIGITIITRGGTVSVVIDLNGKMTSEYLTYCYGTQHNKGNHSNYQRFQLRCQMLQSATYLSTWINMSSNNQTSIKLRVNHVSFIPGSFLPDCMSARDEKEEARVIAFISNKERILSFLKVHAINTAIAPIISQRMSEFRDKYSKELRNWFIERENDYGIMVTPSNYYDYDRYDVTEISEILNGITVRWKLNIENKLYAIMDKIIGGKLNEFSVKYNNKFTHWSIFKDLSGSRSVIIYGPSDNYNLFYDEKNIEHEVIDGTPINWTILKSKKTP